LFGKKKSARTGKKTYKIRHAGEPPQKTMKGKKRGWFLETRQI